MKPVIYKIKVTNWDKYNSAKKKGHRNFMLSSGFLSDAKIRCLNPSQTLLFLCCLCLSAESNTSEFSVEARLMSSQCRVKPGLIPSQLRVLEQLQLVTVEKIEFLINRIEEKRIEEKRIVVPNGTTSAVVDNSPTARRVSKKVEFVFLPDRKPIEITQALLSSWADTYPQEFLKEEFKKARNWVLSNPDKAPKSAWSRFLNGWFSRNWENYRKTLKSNPVKLTAEQVEEILGGQTC